MQATPTPGDAIAARDAIERRTLIGRIHAAKTAARMGDDAYRSALIACTGQRSCTGMNLVQLGAALRHLEKCVAASSVKQPSAASVKKRWVEPFKTDEQRQPLVRKLAAVLAAQGKDWAYADGIAKQMHGLDSVRFADAYQLRGLVTALEKQNQRVTQSKPAGGAPRHWYNNAPKEAAVKVRMGADRD
jgi:phage gp16-like protein